MFNSNKKELAVGNVMMSVNQVKAHSNICDEKSTKYYARVVCIRNNIATSSDAEVLLQTKCSGDISEEFCGYNISELKKAAKIAKLNKQTDVTLEENKDNCIAGSYPPVTAAFPANPGAIASYDLDKLITVLQALRAAAGKNTIVTLSAEQKVDAGEHVFTRPLLLTCLDDKQQECRGLIVSKRL